MAGVRGVGMVLSVKGGTEARNRFGACRQAWIHLGGRMGRGDREHSTEGWRQQTGAWGGRLRRVKSNGQQGLAVGCGPAGPACLVRVS